jgi:hypothetical protein
MASFREKLIEYFSKKTQVEYIEDIDDSSDEISSTFYDVIDLGLYYETEKVLYGLS